MKPPPLRTALTVMTFVVFTVVAVLFLAPLVTATVRSAPCHDAFQRAGEGVGKVIPRGRWWWSNGPYSAVFVHSLPIVGSGPAIAEASNAGLCIPVPGGTVCIPIPVPGGDPANLTVPVSALAASAVLPLVLVSFRKLRRDPAPPGRPRRAGIAVPLAGAVGLVIGASELAIRIFWDGAESSLEERFRFYDTTGEHIVGGGWVLLHGEVLAMTPLPLWLIRIGLWGLALLGVAAIAGWKPARRPPIAAVWIALCLLLLASPWSLAFLIGPMFIS